MFTPWYFASYWCDITICYFMWSLPTIDSDVSTDNGPSSEEYDDSPLDPSNNRKVHCPWNSWDAFVQELDSSNVTQTVCFSAASATSGMPLEEARSSLHREKVGIPPCPDNLCVARPVGKTEIDWYEGSGLDSYEADNPARRVARAWVLGFGLCRRALGQEWIRFVLGLSC